MLTATYCIVCRKRGERSLVNRRIMVDRIGYRRSIRTNSGKKRRFRRLVYGDLKIFSRRNRAGDDARRDSISA